MWNITKKDIPKKQIEAEYMRIIEAAVQDCMEDYDIRTAELYEALEYFEAKSMHSWGFTVFKQGLEDWNPVALVEGLKLIKTHLGP